MATTSPRRFLAWRLLSAFAEARHQAHAMERLFMIPDESLAARGLTRDGEMRRIMGLD